MCSVDIPHYGKTAETKCQLHPVLARKFVQCPVITVDDRSTDRSGEQWKRFTDPDLSLIRLPNGGLVAACDRRIPGPGQWGIFLHSDDT